MHVDAVKRAYDLTCVHGGFYERLTDSPPHGAVSVAEAAQGSSFCCIARYARDLVQLPAERKVPADPSKWQCDDTGVTDNLWLNLSTGHIGSGRQVGVGWC